jgi:Flp pilus assembly protein TadG
MSTIMPRGGKARPGFQQFKSDAKGDVAIMFGFTAVIMMMFIGAAVDIGRWLHVTRQTKLAVDTAVLAGARVLQVKGTTAASIVEAQTTALAFYTQNTAHRLPLYSHSATFIPVDNNTAFAGTVVAQIETPILRVGNAFGITDFDKLAVNATAEAVVSAGQNAGYNLEISMMLDVSGSMDGDKLVALKSASKGLIDTVIWADQSSHTSKVSLAPFSAAVRLPTSWNVAARGNASEYVTQTDTGTNRVCTGSGRRRVCNDVPYSNTYNIGRLTPCIGERHGANKFTDVAPGPGNYVTPEYNTNTSSTSCSQGQSEQVVALSNNKQTLKDTIDDMEIGGGTAGHLGTAWAWYTLSPNWADVFPAASQPAAYTDTSTKKIAILMTDGEYNKVFTAQGFSTGSNSPNGNSPTQAKALCDGMKAKGITVYTVGFDLGGNQTAINTLTYCASSGSHHYNADDGNELTDAFNDIATRIVELHLRK